ncbi:MAG: hypothetical protein J6A01_08950 [Proteobacteria bacterium]|nr:hypothetical protein [Pseudomonadota bacterium]
MEFPYKTRLCDTESLQILHIGPSSEMPFYLFADVLDELVFYANDKNAFGLLVGNAFLDADRKIEASGENLPPEKTKTFDTDVPDFVEITAFKDVYPVKDALDYAGYLRKMRNFRDTETDGLCLGAVCLMPQSADLTLECLYLMRTYFDLPNQILLFVSADRKPPRAYQLNKKLDMVEVGLDIVTLKNETLPFDL